MKLPGHDAIARQADEHLVTHRVRLSRKVVERPIRQVAKRLLMAFAVLVGTTLEVLTERTREEWRLNRWSQRCARCTATLQEVTDLVIAT